MGNCFRPSGASSLGRKLNMGLGECGGSFNPQVHPYPSMLRGGGGGNMQHAAGEKVVLSCFTGRKVKPDLDS